MTVDISASDFRENAGSAIHVEAREQSAVTIAVEMSSSQNLGASFLDVTATQSALARVLLHSTRVTARGSDRSLVSVNLADAARGCVDVSGNELISGGAHPTIAINARSPQSQLQVVDAAAATIDAAVPPTIVTTCR